MRLISLVTIQLALASALTLGGCPSERSTPRDGGIGFDTGGGGGDGGADSGMPANCDNGILDGNETSADCGGSCLPCADGRMCAAPMDCESMVCRTRYCLVASCTDGVQNGAETGLDCGGGCGRCVGGVACTAGTDCLSGECLPDSTCSASGCEDGEQNQDETGVDCGGMLCRACAGGEGCLRTEDCMSSICDAGTCTASTCMDRTLNQEETSTDCGGPNCDGCPDMFSCLIDTDCSGMRCVSGACVSCMDGVQTAEETDVDCGGGLCDTCDDREMCIVGTDCTGGTCETGLCVSCMDGVQNQDESDADCGGTLCGGCGTGGACGVAADCTSNICDGPTGTCNAPGCGDGVLNGAETDLDCGGGSCLACMDGLTCTGAADCQSGVCTGGVCQVPTCTDGARNGGETDTDCGGPDACPRCADRQRCGAASDCTSDVCTSPPGRCGVFAGCYWGLISQETQFTDANIQNLFTLNGHTFDVLSSNGTGGVHSSNATTLATYDVVVLHEHDRVLSAAENTALTAFLNRGGRLIVTGYDSLGSPTDSTLAGLVRCASPSDGPFSTAIVVDAATHGIMSGPAQTFTMGQALTATTTDHDRCTPTGGAVRLASVGGTSSKLQITEGIGTGNGMVVYWNGNGVGSGALTDWNTTAATPTALQNLFVNTLEYLCATP